MLINNNNNDDNNSNNNNNNNSNNNSTESVLLWGKVEIASAEGIQQGDPIGPLLFCLSIHDFVSILKSEYKVFYLDDGTIGGTLEVWA